MKFLETVAQALQDAGVGVKGSDIFIHALPQGVNEGIMILMPLAGVEINHELPNYFVGRFMVVVRHSKTKHANDLGLQVSQALTKKATTLGDFKVNYIRPDRWPVAYPIGESGQLEVSVTFDFSIVDQQP